MSSNYHNNGLLVVFWSPELNRAGLSLEEGWGGGQHSTSVEGLNLPSHPKGLSLLPV